MWPVNVFFLMYLNLFSTLKMMILLSMDWHANHLPTIQRYKNTVKYGYSKLFSMPWIILVSFRRFSNGMLHVNRFFFSFFPTVYIYRVLFLPFGESCTAGHECMLGSAMYLKSTGISLKNNIAIFCITKVRSSFNKQFYLNSSFN